MDGSALENLKRIFAQRLQTERRDRDLTQEQLAERIGRSVDLISRLERCATAPSLETLALLSIEFNVDPASLLTFSSIEADQQRGDVSELIDLVLSLPASDTLRVRKVIEAFK